MNVEPNERLSIIVPVFNEVATIAAVIDRLRTIALPLPREILVVDDGSTDGTRELLQGMGEMPEVAIVYAPRNAGKGAAIRTGLSRAGGSIIAIQDADLELEPAELAQLVLPLLARHADVVYGSRFLLTMRSKKRATGAFQSVPLKTHFANRALTMLTNVLYGASLTDMETCYKIMRTEVARGLELESDRFDIEPEITAKLLRAGHRITELPVSFKPRSRAAGKKIGWRDGVQAVRVLLKYRLKRA